MRLIERNCRHEPDFVLFAERAKRNKYFLAGNYCVLRVYQRQLDMHPGAFPRPQKQQVKYRFEQIGFE